MYSDYYPYRFIPDDAPTTFRIQHIVTYWAFELTIKLYPKFSPDQIYYDVVDAETFFSNALRKAGSNYFVNGLEIQRFTEDFDHISKPITNTHLMNIDRVYSRLQGAILDGEINVKPSGLFDWTALALWAKSSFRDGDIPSFLQKYLPTEPCTPPRTSDLRGLRPPYPSQLLELQFAAMDHFWGTPDKRRKEIAPKKLTIVNWLTNEWTTRKIPFLGNEKEPSKVLCEKMATIIRPSELR